MTSSNMYRSQKSQSLKLVAIAILLILTPLVSTSLRLKYLYFIVNILIIAVGAEAGLVSFFLQSAENKILVEPAANIAQDQSPTISEVSPSKARNMDHDKENIIEVAKHSDNRTDVVSPDEEPVVKKPVNVNEYRSRPASIFFIGGGEARELIDQDNNEGEELFEKAETFIGNFYKQLKMQREESWKKLHHLSHKPF